MSNSELDKLSGYNLFVGSGVESSTEARVETQLNDYGFFQPAYSRKLSAKNTRGLLSVSLNSNESKSESVMADELFSGVKSMKHDGVIGYYLDLYAGYVKEGDFRRNGSSGGFTSWMASELMHGGHIDGFLHVKKTNSDKGVLFEYAISRTVKEILSGAKSRYYPAELSGALREVRDKPGRYAIVGIPEVLSEVRLLAYQDPEIKSSIKYYIGLVCGHQKSTKYAEAIAWEQGIKPGDLMDIDFRVKSVRGRAIDYYMKLVGLVNGRKKEITVRQDKSFVSNWAHGFFKLKFSDFTDNVFNDVADITVGDAWLEEYIDDPMGTNIIIVRNEELGNIIRVGMKRGALALDSVDAETIKRSQSGLIHHVRDELPYRLYKHASKGEFVPEKRVRPSNNLSRNRKDVQDIREKIAAQSHIVYMEAVKREDFNYFLKKMQKYTKKYTKLYTNEGNLVGSFRNGLSRFTKGGSRVSKKLVSQIANIPNHLKEKSADGVILTLTGYYNHGNVIQKFALQRFLRNNGRRFVVYADSYMSSQSTYVVPRKIIAKTPLRYIKRLMRSQSPLWYIPRVVDLYPDMAWNENLINFANKYIWQKPFNVEDKDNFRNYIVGSDQVWRSWYPSNEERKKVGYYFMDFLGNRDVNRISYAASFGKDKLDGVLSNDFIKYIKPHVKKFNAISVRERSAVDIINKNWGAHAVEVVDPTLLLNKDEYSRVIDSSDAVMQDTAPVFYYLLDMTGDKQKLVQRAVKTMKSSASGIYPDGEEVLPSVEVWLKSIRDSELVITDSFHGTVFSIIFHTPFVVVGNEDRGLSRIVDLLQALGLSERLVLEDSVTQFDIRKLGPIDWDDVQQRLDKKRELSAEWLLGNIR